MNNFIKENWFKLVIAICIVITGFSIFYYYVLFLPFLPYTEVENLKKTNNISTDKILENKTEETKNDAITKKSEAENLEIVLINYKIDIAEVASLIDSALGTSYNNSARMCPSVIATKTSRQNIYWMAKDEFTKIDIKYGKYKNNVPYIANNLYSYANIFKMIEDTCMSIGYNISE